MKIAGIQLRPLKRIAAMAEFSRILRGDRGAMVLTINPEMIVHASKDVLFRNIIHAADVHLIDGFGIELVTKFRRGPAIERFPGVDAVDRIAGLAAMQGNRVFLLGSGSSTTLLSAANALRRRYSLLHIVGTHPGYEMVEHGQGIAIDPQENQEIVDRINATRPDILLVGFGHGKQEKWMWQNKSALPSVRLFMGVGGTFDFLSGRVRRAPAAMRRAGMEWLWRFIGQPWRARRIGRATIVFLWKALR